MGLLMTRKEAERGELTGQKVTVVGLGMEGVDLVRHFAARGADVTVSDARPAKRLSTQLTQLAGLNIALSLGQNDPASAAHADAVYVSQGVPLTIPLVAGAAERGTPIGSMMQLFLRECRGRVVGVTGSSGKSTTTALLGEMFNKSGRKSFTGGNIGVPLLEKLDEIDEGTWVVLEISHTQLALTDRSPEIAAITNVTPNHLDRFSWDEYVALKGNILAYQEADNAAVLNADNEVTRRFADEARGRVVMTTLGDPDDGDWVYLEDERVLARLDGDTRELFALADIRLPGQHNVENALTAAAVAAVAGVEPDAIKRAIQGFRGIPHRLELVRRVDSVRYYNDSIATTPERTVAGLRAFAGEPILLLLGGRHKHLPWDPLVGEAKERCRLAICFGEAGAEIEAALKVGGFGEAMSVGDLHDAVEKAVSLAQSGDIVLFSPACTSFDAYENFEERGEHFRRLVGAIKESR